MHPHQASIATSVSVESRLEGDLLAVYFEVKRAVPPHLNSALGLGASQWGLWDWDVVEVFVSCSGTPDALPYYEFEVSPLGQYLELEILEPRKRVNRDFESGFVHRVVREAEGSVPVSGNWRADLQIPLRKLGWDGRPESIRGNLFAVLGAPPDRTYWSLFLGPQTKPDFHLPQAFKGLVTS